MLCMPWFRCADLRSVRRNYCAYHPTRTLSSIKLVVLTFYLPRRPQEKPEIWRYASFMRLPSRSTAMASSSSSDRLKLPLKNRTPNQNCSEQGRHSRWRRGSKSLDERKNVCLFLQEDKVFDGVSLVNGRNLMYLLCLCTVQLPK